MNKKHMFAVLLCCMLLFSAAALAAPVDMKIPPQAIETQAEGELEMYDLEFPEEMPLAARNFVLTARAEFEKHPFEKLPKAFPKICPRLFPMIKAIRNETSET